MADCVFCKLLDGSLAASWVYRDELCAAFMDVRPLTAGHLLIIPVQHAGSLTEVKVETAAQMMRVAHRLDRALRESGIRCEGVNLIIADGVAAGQEVFHVHMHVFPAYRNDGFGLQFPSGFGRIPPRAELDAAAALIQSALK